MNYGSVSVGLDEIVGLDDYQDLVSGGEVSIGQMNEIIGASMGPAASAQFRALLARARQVDANAKGVVQRPVGARRVKILPVPAALNVATGDPFATTAETQDLFQSERLVVLSTIGAFFVLNDIKVATTSMFAADGDCPAEIFRPDAVGVGIQFKTANPGEKIVLRGQNIDAASQSFRAAFIGTAIQS